MRVLLSCLSLTFLALRVVAAAQPGAGSPGVGDQTLILDYKGVNHAAGNIFIYAPRQKVLMLVDVIYPGWMPYKNLGIAEDVPGYIQAHREALSYDFDVLVAGHVDRLGTRQDVETSLGFVNELRATVFDAMRKLDFPTYLRSTASTKHRWVRHNAYEKALVEQCYAQMFPRWSARLAGAETYLRDNCWAMLESLAVQFPVARPPSVAREKADR